MNKAKTILAIDDELSIREAFKLILSDDYDLQLAASGEAALQKVADQKIHMAFLDIRMPGMDGLETLRKILQIDPSVRVIMVTAVNDVQKASEAIRVGAVNYIIKPFDVEQILKIARQTLDEHELREEANFMGRRPEDLVLGQSDKIHQLEKELAELSALEEAIVISGPLGTEKEKAAKLVHYNSRRRFGPFVTMDLGETVSSQAAKLMFYGRVSGESIYMLSTEKGALERANGGTLVINNFENLPLSFLNALKENVKDRTFAKVDGMSSLPLDVQIIFTTSLVDTGWSKEICIPPLRERLTDIPYLLEHFLERYKRIYQRTTKGFTKAALDVLTGYDWPGNALEMENLVRGELSSGNPEWITLKMLPINILISTFGTTHSEEAGKLEYESLLEEFEKEWIKKALSFAKGNHQEASRLLGITPAILSAKI